MLPADSPFASLSAPGPHPATAELRAYAAGTLSGAEQQRIEAHLLDCERCAELVEGFSMSDAATTDHAVAALRSRLQARIGIAEPAPVAAPRAWPRVAAAAALMGVVAGGIWTWEQRDNSTLAPVARTESAPAAEVVQPASPPIMAPETAPETVPTPSAAGKQMPADYAAVTVAPPRPSFPRPARQVNRKPVVLADKVPEPNTDVLAMGRAEITSDAVALSEAVGVKQEQPAAAATIAAASPSPAAAKRARASQAESPSSPDSIGTSSGYSVAGIAAKEKAFVPAENRALVASEAARVLATPLPSAISIKPVPAGGPAALRDYLRRQASEFEPEDNALRLSGMVRVKFIVGADGKVTDLKVTRGLRDDYDAEAIRMLCEGPAWQPGVAGGRRAPLPMEVTVTF